MRTSPSSIALLPYFLVNYKFIFAYVVSYFTFIVIIDADENNNPPQSYIIIIVVIIE